MGKTVEVEFSCLFIQLKQLLNGRQKPSGSGSNNSSTTLLKTHYWPSLHGEPRSLLQPITPEEIQRAQKSLRNGRATRPDGIQNDLLKYTGYAFSTAISHTINTVFETHTPLGAMDISILVSLPKPKKRLGPLSNLRPMALLNSIRKILSTVVLRCIQHKVNLFPGL